MLAPAIAERGGGDCGLPGALSDAAKGKGMVCTVERVSADMTCMVGTWYVRGSWGAVAAVAVGVVVLGAAVVTGPALEKLGTGTIPGGKTEIIYGCTKT